MWGGDVEDDRRPRASARDGASVHREAWSANRARRLDASDAAMAPSRLRPARQTMIGFKKAPEKSRRLFRKRTIYTYVPYLQSTYVLIRFYVFYVQYFSGTFLYRDLGCFSREFFLGCSSQTTGGPVPQSRSAPESRRVLCFHCTVPLLSVRTTHVPAFRRLFRPSGSRFRRLFDCIVGTPNRQVHNAGTVLGSEGRARARHRRAEKSRRREARAIDGRAMRARWRVLRHHRRSRAPPETTCPARSKR